MENEAKLAVVPEIPEEMVFDYTDPETEIVFGGNKYMLVYSLGAIKEFALTTKHNILEGGLTTDILMDPDKLIKLLSVGLEEKQPGMFKAETLAKMIHTKNWTYVINRIKVALDIVLPHPKEGGKKPPLEES